MWDYIFTFFSDNYLELILLTALTFLIISDKAFSSQSRAYMMFLIPLFFIMIIFNFMDKSINELGVYEFDTNAVYMVRAISAAVGYCLRPVALYVSVLLIFNLNIVKHIYMAIPAFINIVIMGSSPWTHWAFYVTARNVFVNGPLKMVYIVTCVIYILLEVIYFIVKFKKYIPRERITAAFIILLIIVSSVFGILENSVSESFMLAMVCCFIIYYLFLSINKNNEQLVQKEQIVISQNNELLRSQISPHFIYNTLNCIYALCQTNPDEAGSTILDFSSYLRQNLDLSSRPDLIDINDEITHTKLYTNIEQKRFPGLTINYIIDDKNYKIPYLTIQPMVENAIRHGVRGMKNGQVDVILRVVNINNVSYHEIVVKDNGNGKSKSNTTLGDHKGIGIANVKSRIETQASGTFDISMLDAGTTVTMRIPV